MAEGLRSKLPFIVCYLGDNIHEHASANAIHVTFRALKPLFRAVGVIT